MEPNERQKLSILSALDRHYLLSSEQIRRVLGFSPKSYKKVIRLMYWLFLNGYVRRDQVPEKTAFQKPYYYALAEKGRLYLARRGMTSLDSKRDKHGKLDLSHGHISHALATTDVMLAAETAVRTGKVQIGRMFHDRQLKQRASRVRYEGEEIYISPDAWIEFYFPDQTQDAVAFEVDMGSEHVSRWRQRCRGMLAWSDGPYQRVFETEALVVAVRANTAERARQLRHWTQLELTRLGREEARTLFLFSAADPVDDPEYFYFGRHWRHPFDHTPRPLLEVE
jgi:uncharacterized protein YndB with AHSA1/START domain